MRIRKVKEEVVVKAKTKGRPAGSVNKKLKEDVIDTPPGELTRFRVKMLTLKEVVLEQVNTGKPEVYRMFRDNFVSAVVTYGYDVTKGFIIPVYLRNGFVILDSNYQLRK